jgi:hypothetical protein
LVAASAGIWPGPKFALIVAYHKMKAIMRVPTKEESARLAVPNSPTSEYEHGYVHGERSRTLNEAPPKYVMIGIDDYAFGFRAAYFANVRSTPRADNLGK